MCGTGTFLIRVLPRPDNRGLLPNPKHTYDSNLSAVYFEHVVILHPNIDCWNQKLCLFLSFFVSLPSSCRG